MKTLSQVLLDRKREKVRQQVSEDVARWMSGGPFRNFAHPPSASQAVEMILASRFGPGDPLSAGGDSFLIEYLLDELWSDVTDVYGKLLSGNVKHLDPDGTALRVVSSQDEQWANMIFVMDVDFDLARHWAKLVPEDFDIVKDGDLEYAVERETRAFGFIVGVTTMVPASEAVAEWADPVHFIPQFTPSRWKASDKVTIYQMTVGPLDRLLTLEERARHEVSAFDRTLASGRTTRVRPHQRRNPRRLADRSQNLDEVAHVAYRAFDADGRVRYYGEGTAARPSHVNSGASHNYKLNEHFFRRGPMRVEVFANGLSKDEARAIERLCIRGHTGQHELWNVKDYEPGL